MEDEEYMDDFSPLQHDLDEYHNELAEEFADEIEGWVLEELKSIGCDTARSVLDLSVEELVKRTDLEIETVEDVMSILKEEFED